MHVIALCGLPGSGKSTLAAALAEVMRWPVLDRDGLRSRWPKLDYQDVDKRLLNEAMRADMSLHLLGGRSVILDGMTFSRDSERKLFADSARHAGAAWHLVWLACDPAVARERVAASASHPAADRNPGLVDAVHARFEMPTDALRLDARASIDELLAQVVHAFSLHDE